MTPDEFIHVVIDRVLNTTCKSSHDLFDSNTTLEKVNDEYWKRALTLYRSLGTDGREVFKDVVREEAVSAISAFLALLDGVSVAEEAPGRFSLSYDNGPPLNGDLLDIFVEATYG